jgi:hypothetical protein
VALYCREELLVFLGTHGHTAKPIPWRMSAILDDHPVNEFWRLSLVGRFLPNPLENFDRLLLIILPSLFE